ncbi:MAG: hypothetical protein IPH07_02305 [Deltaproteobacteria bacterium]|nr:hypothetical protein [Deltaproteobacteria bacterium]MBK8238156.1 hypothetical protein [Deltaproteobacteria bacterium]MBP7288562.1 hypothetical protein [Nannocystaceae bacterium]
MKTRMMTCNSSLAASPVVTASTPRRLHKAALLCAFAVLACGKDEESGTVTINYTLGAANMCETLGVVTVEADIGAGKATESNPCDPSNPLVVDGLKAGHYAVLVQGFDAEGIAVMDNQGDEDSTSVEVVGGASKEVNASLTATPAIVRLRASPTFDGQPAMCTFAQLKLAGYQVVAYQNSGTNQLLSHDFDCDLDPGYNPVPDPDRQINGQNLDSVTIAAVDDQGAELDRVVFTFDPPGPGRTVDFDIVCDQVGEEVTCTGTQTVGGGGGGGTDGSGGPSSESGAADSSSGAADSGSSTSG